MIKKFFINKFSIPLTVIFLLLLFLFNLRFLSRFFDWDSVIYAFNIERSLRYEKKPLQRNLRSVFINPHHLGFESTGYAFMQMVKKFYPEYDLMFMLRLRILIASLMFLFAFIVLHYYLYKNFLTSFLISMCIAFSQGFWFYSHHNDTPMLPACFIALTFLLAVIFAKRGFSRWSLFLVGFVQLFSLYFHQTNVLFLTLVPVAIFVSKKYRGGDFPISGKLRVSGFYLFAVIAIFTVSYLFVGFYILERDLVSKGDKHFANWLFLYATLDRWGLSAIKKDYIIHFYRGIGDAFLNYQGITRGLRVDFRLPWKAFSVPYNMVALFWIALISIFLLNIKRTFKKYGVELLILFFWLVPSLVFYTWWQGYFFEFWLSTTIALWLFSYWVLESLPLEPLRYTRRAVINTIYIGMIFILFSVNFPLSVFQKSKKVKIGVIGDVESYRESVHRLAGEKVYTK